MLSKKQQVETLLSLTQVSLDLTRALNSRERYRRLLETLSRLVNSDTGAILRFVDGVLHPIAAIGLSPDTMGRVFDPAEHPRLAAILDSREPVRFASNDPRPDPFDGLIAHDTSAWSPVHSCMGCSLYDGNELLGALTLDALEPGRFDGVDLCSLSAFASLAAAALRTADLIVRLEESAEHSDQVARSIVAEELRRRGGQLLGNTEAMMEVRREIAVAAPTDISVLITGETGTGKELVARSIHARSNRSTAALVYVNCAALPETIAESELFGHVRGAFTGADRDRKGKFELAHGATLFLDEIGDLPLGIQTKLLRVLQFGEVQRVGSDSQRVVDVRVISATNRDLEAEMKTNRFRDDLYHRLNGYPIHVPPLRDRADDIPMLAGHLLDRSRMRLGLGRIRTDVAANTSLTRYDWPGNVRELEHTLCRAALRAAGTSKDGDVVISAAHLSIPTATAAATATITPDLSTALEVSDGNLSEMVDDFKGRLIRDAVEAEDGNWSQAARRLGVDRGNLHRIAQRLGLKD